MPIQIRDGRGSGNLAEVSDDGHVQVDAITLASAVESNQFGDAYNINTDIVNLTTATETPLIFVKNNEEQDLIINAIVIGIFNSTGGLATANVTSTFIRNPTGGSIITSAATVPIVSNRNYASNNELGADVFLGGTGDTLTGGEDHILVRLELNSRTFIGINEILPKGTAIGVKILPPTSNTSLDVYVAILCHLQVDG